MDGTLRVVQSSGKKIDWQKVQRHKIFREFLERQSKNVLDKTDEKLKEKLENQNQDAASKMLTKGKELAEVVLFLILGFILILDTYPLDLYVI